MHQTHPTSRDLLGERRSPTDARRLRAIFGVAVLASILTATTGCDKNAETAEVVHRRRASRTGRTSCSSCSATTPIRGCCPSPRRSRGQVAPVSLDAQGWRDFDHIYFRPGRPALAVSRRAAGRRGRDPARDVGRPAAALHASPLPLPEAARRAGPSAVRGQRGDAGAHRHERPARAAPGSRSGSAPVPSTRRARSRSRSRSTRASPATRARSSISPVYAIRTGATHAPTLVASYMERGGGIQGHPRHLFVLADSTAERLRAHLRALGGRLASRVPALHRPRRRHGRRRGRAAARRDGRTEATASCSSCATPTASGARWRAARRAGAPTRRRSAEIARSRPTRATSLHADVPGLLKILPRVRAERGERLRALKTRHGREDLRHDVRDLVVLRHLARSRPDPNRR